MKMCSHWSSVIFCNWMFSNAEPLLVSINRFLSNLASCHFTTLSEAYYDKAHIFGTFAQKCIYPDPTNQQALKSDESVRFIWATFVLQHAVCPLSTSQGELIRIIPSPM